MAKTLSVDDETIYHEMISHTVIFAHGRAKNIVIIGDEDHGILREVLKHNSVAHITHLAPHTTKTDIQDTRVDFITDINAWIASAPITSLDIIIIGQDATPDNFKTYFNLLNDDGIFVQKSQSLFDLTTNKSLQKKLIKTGFTDIHFLSFPQPTFESGWRTVLIAKKHGNLKRPREKDVFNKSFATHYYNFDIHKASLVLPEFIRAELQPSHDE